MKTLAISLIIATMVATVSAANVELSDATTSAQFLKFFGFISLLLIDIYVIVSILRKNKQD